MSAFTDAVARETAGLRDINVTSEESHFSWSPCDTCGSMLGGSREDALAHDGEGDLIELEICSDCAMYFANGDEPEHWRVA